MHTGVHTLVLLLLLLFALEPSSCPADTDACSSPHSHPVVAGYTGAHACVLLIRVYAGVSYSRTAVADYTGARARVQPIWMYAGV